MKLFRRNKSNETQADCPCEPCTIFREAGIKRRYTSLMPQPVCASWHPSTEVHPTCGCPSCVTRIRDAKIALAAHAMALQAGPAIPTPWSHVDAEIPPVPSTFLHTVLADLSEISALDVS